MGESGVFHSVNPAFKKVLGYDEEDVIGARFVKFLVEEDRDRFTVNFAALTAGGNEPFDIRMVTREGKIVYVQCSCFWSDAEKSLFCVLRDVSEAREAEHLKQEIMAMVTHDLRSPLTSVSLLLEGIVENEEENVSEKVYETLKRSQTEINRLVRLANTLLDLEKLESGIIELDIGKESLVEIVQTATDAVTGLCVPRKVSLVQQVDDAIISCDADKIIQVIINLLSNAIKFSPRNSSILVKTEMSDERLRFEVIDQGSGIADVDKGKLFQRFSQLDQIRVLQKTGAGLGLFISRRLVEAHGGSIGYTRLEKGSCFWFEIPVVQVQIDSLRS